MPLAARAARGSSSASCSSSAPSEVEGVACVVGPTVGFGGSKSGVRDGGSFSMVHEVPLITPLLLLLLLLRLSVEEEEDGTSAGDARSATSLAAPAFQLATTRPEVATVMITPVAMTTRSKQSAQSALRRRRRSVRCSASDSATSPPFFRTRRATSTCSRHPSIPHTHTHTHTL